MVLLLQVADSLRSVLLLHVTGRDDAPCRTIQSPRVTAGLLHISSPCVFFLITRRSGHLLSPLKTRLGLILAKAVAMRVMINATGCPAPMLDRNRHEHTQAPFPTVRLGDRS